MGRTITLELHPEVVERLHACALAFRPLFGRSDRFNQGRIFLYGLLVDGERKSIEPLSRRVLGGDDQRLQQFVNQSPWDPAPVLAAYRARLAAEFAWVRVWPAHRWQDGVPAEAIPDPAEAARWLLVE